MPGRTEPLYVNQYYHVFNKSIRHAVVFAKKQHYEHFLKLLIYYQSSDIVHSYSRFKRFPLVIQKLQLKSIMKSSSHLVDIHCFCLMPTHFHLLLRQKQLDGIARFIGNVINAYTRYHNTKSQSIGPFFLPRFKAVRIHTTVQYKHVSRYIHLNPYTAGIVQTMKNLENYPWSSYREYMQSPKKRICMTKTIFRMFKTSQNYNNFVNNRADYQRNLERLKYTDC